MSVQPAEYGAATIINYLTGRFVLEINLGTRTVPSWSQVVGVKELTDKVDPTMQDNTDYDSGPWMSQTKTALAWSLETTLNLGKDYDTGVVHPTHVRLRRAQTRFNQEGYVEVRWYDRDGEPEAYQGLASVSWERGGGTKENLDSAKVTFTGQGARLEIENPAAAAAGPSIGSINPTTAPTGGGRLVTLTGAGFLGTTAVTFGATVATQFVVIDDTHIAATAPAHAAGVVQVTVTDPIDTSTGVNFTYA